MRRSLAALVALAILVAGAPALGGAQTTVVSVSNVTVEPASPMPGEAVTITPTISNTGDNGNYRITDVAIRTAGSSNEHARVSNAGNIGPGQSISVPITATFDEQKSYSLRIKVYGENASSGDNQQLSYPLTLNVNGQHPGLNVQTDDSVVGVDERATVRLANGLEHDISNVKFGVVSTDGIDAPGSDKVRARVASGETAVTNVTYRPTEQGEHTLNTSITYTTAGGTVRHIYSETRIVAEQLDEQVVLETQPLGNASGTAVQARVLNVGNAPIEDVSVSGTTANGSVSPTVLDRVPAGESRTVRLNASLSEPSATVTVTADYQIGTSRGSATSETQISETAGTIDLTGVDAVREGGRVHVSGTAANVGLSDVDSARVRVVDTDGVTPASPSKEYFIGTIPASDFVSFDLYATTSANVTEVPVRVEYIVDGHRESRVFDFEAPASRAQVERQTDDGGSGGSGGLLLPLGIGALALLVVGGVVARYYFAGSDDDEI